MLMKKVFLALLMTGLLLAGCSSKPNETASVIEIGVKDAVDKLEKKDSFVLLVTRSKCGYCEALLEYLDTTLEEHALTIYNAVMDDTNSETLTRDIEALSAYLERPDQTPHYYYISQGKVADAEKGFTPAQPDRFWNWVERNAIEADEALAGH